MAAVDDLIAQIEDPALRERLAREVAELQRARKFGLVFEQHLPELLPIYSATPRPGDLVGKRGGALTETWLVLKIDREQVHGIRRDAKKPEILALNDVVVVRQFGDPIFPALEPHDPTRSDNVAKAVGLAQFAEKHGHLFGHIELIRRHQTGGREGYVRLDFNDLAIRRDTVRITTPAQLDEVFAQRARSR